MNVSHDSNIGNDATESDPTTWPSWTDEWSYVPSLPFDEDLDQVDESAAIESAAQDLLERSLIPGDVVDQLLHHGSDPQWCICTACVMYRTSRFLD